MRSISKTSPKRFGSLGDSEFKGAQAQRRRMLMHLIKQKIQRGAMPPVGVVRFETGLDASEVTVERPFTLAQWLEGNPTLLHL
jgi:hypothetical protein